MSENPPRALPRYVTSPSFPFDGQLRVKHLDALAPEPDRLLLDHTTCASCQAPDDAYVWVSERWRVRSGGVPGGLPMMLVLESRSHLDLGDLPNTLAAELGVMTVRVERAIRSLDNVAHVHVTRHSEDSTHLQFEFYARPTGRRQLAGPFVAMWNDILPPIDAERWHEDLALIAAWLGEFGGRAVAEPPRIVWHAPSSFAEANAAAVLASDAESARSGEAAAVGGDAAAERVEATPAGDPVAGESTSGAEAVAVSADGGASAQDGRSGAAGGSGSGGPAAGNSGMAGPDAGPTAGGGAATIPGTPPEATVGDAVAGPAPMAGGDGASDTVSGRGMPGRAGAVAAVDGPAVAGGSSAASVSDAAANGHAAPDAATPATAVGDPADTAAASAEGDAAGQAAASNHGQSATNGTAGAAQPVDASSATAGDAGAAADDDEGRAVGRASVDGDTPAPTARGVVALPRQNAGDESMAFINDIDLDMSKLS